jgi:hypothetical protein
VDLALVDVAALGFEDVFDRVLEGENVVLAVAVDEIDERGEGGGFAGADRTGDEDQAVLVAGEGRMCSSGRPMSSMERIWVLMIRNAMS